MTHSVMVAVAVGLLAPANAAIQWDTTYGKSPLRRLAVQTVNSHNDSADASCIVGGYDPDHPTRIYVGGPCSLISNGQPQTGFRWVVMETVDASLVGSDGTEADMVPHTGAGSSFMHSADYTDYAEAGAGMTMKFAEATIGEASMFMSTTSYLSKANFGFTMNDFVIGVDENNASKKDFIRGVCVKPCPGTTPVTCTACPTEQITATKGMYKYSILAAAYDHSAGASTKGWEKIRNTYGTGNPKTLTGDFNVYQAIDFTNMNADTLTVTGPNGTAVTYASMDACDMSTFRSVANPSMNCTVYDVASVTVESDGWQGSYAFPLTFNVGDWSQPTGGVVTPTMGGTRTVIIRCVRPSGANLASVGMTATSKAVYLEYKFDVSGITASQGTGKYMVYDPTITTGSGSSGSGSGSGGSGSKTGTTSSAPTSAGLTMLTALMMLLTVLK
jgi:hypothetical protein